MIDYCIKCIDESEFDQMLLDSGLGVEVTDDEETTVQPASYEVLIDRIGPITIGEVTYPEYYANIRILGLLNEEQVKIVDQFAIDPNAPQYRNWA